MHKSVFSLSKRGDQWSTHHGKHTFINQIVYPNFVSCIVGDVFDNGESMWVLRAVEKADELGFTHIDVCCGASIPTERVERSGEETKDLFRCHPSFHSYPYLRRSWHDWAMIKWSDDANEDSVYTAAARLLMFAKLSQHNADTTTPPRVVAVIQSLSQVSPQSDSVLKFALGDKVDRNPIVVDVDAIASTAFVLPCVESPTDQFPVDIEKATYFLVMPPRGDWKNIGWDAAY
jgi:hypothetical protein